MIDQLPQPISIFFIITTLVCLALFHYSNLKNSKLTIIIIGYATVQSTLAYFGFYQNINAIPPRVVFIMLPFFTFLYLGLRGDILKNILAQKSLAKSTLVHTVRIPVEIVLYLLYTYQMVPKLMTFEGRNFDILIGLLAPITAFLFHKQKINHQHLLLFNFIGLGFVLFILINGVLSAQSPLQQFAFQQPNKAILYFPFILLPSIIVPIVIYTHLTDIIFILNKPNK